MEEFSCRIQFPCKCYETQCKATKIILWQLRKKVRETVCLEKVESTKTGGGTIGPILDDISVELLALESRSSNKAGPHYLTMDAQWQREMTSVVSANGRQCIPYSCTVSSIEFNMYRLCVCLQHCHESGTYSEILHWVSVSKRNVSTSH